MGRRRADACGVCGGDNSTCRAVSGIFTRPQLPPGLNVIALLPQGACNLSIAQLRPTRNLLLPRPVVLRALGAVLHVVRPGRAVARRRLRAVAARPGPLPGPGRRVLRRPPAAGAAAAVRGANVPAALVRGGVERVLPLVRHRGPEEGGALHRAGGAVNSVLRGLQAAHQEAVPGPGVRRHQGPVAVRLRAVVRDQRVRHAGRAGRRGRAVRGPAAELPPRGAGPPLQVLVLRHLLLPLVPPEGRVDDSSDGRLLHHHHQHGVMDGVTR